MTSAPAEAVHAGTRERNNDAQLCEEVREGLPLLGELDHDGRELVEDEEARQALPLALLDGAEVLRHGELVRVQSLHAGQCNGRRSTATRVSDAGTATGCNRSATQLIGSMKGHLAAQVHIRGRHDLDVRHEHAAGLACRAMADEDTAEVGRLGGCYRRPDHAPSGSDRTTLSSGLMMPGKSSPNDNRWILWLRTSQGCS